MHGPANLMMKFDTLTGRENFAPVDRNGTSEQKIQKARLNSSEGRNFKQVALFKMERGAPSPLQVIRKCQKTVVGGVTGL